MHGGEQHVWTRDDLLDAALDVVQRAWLGLGLGLRRVCRVRALCAMR